MGPKAPSAVATSSHPRGVLGATILGSSMAFIDGTVVNVALPSLQANLGATIVDVQWVVEAYTLFLASLMLTGGALGDRYGRKRIFVVGVAVFTAGSAACGLAPGIAALIASRALQGIGAALMVPGSLAIISASFADDARGKAIGTWSAFTSITMIIGPLVGGTLIDHVSWRAIFFINVPLAALVLYLTGRFVPESREPTRRPLDVAGALLATTGLGGLVFGLIESSVLGFASPLIRGALVAGVALLALFVAVEWRSKSPMMPLSLFRSPAFCGTNLLTLFLYGALGGGLFFVPMNLIQVHGFSATAAGAAMVPSVLLLFLLSRWAGGLADRAGARRLLIVGPCIAAVGFALFAVGDAGSSYWTGFFPAFVVLGFGMALTVAPLTTTVMSSVSRSHAGIASGINNAVSETAGLLAVAVLGLAMTFAFHSSLEARMDDAKVAPPLRAEIRGQESRLAAIAIPAQVAPAQRASVTGAIRASFVAGFRLVMAIAAALAFLSAVCAWITIAPKTSTSTGAKPRA